VRGGYWLAPALESRRLSGKAWWRCGGDWSKKYGLFDRLEVRGYQEIESAVRFFFQGWAKLYWMSVQCNWLVLGLRKECLCVLIVSSLDNPGDEERKREKLKRRYRCYIYCFFERRVAL